MSHKDAPPETAEQVRMREFYTARGVVCGWGRAKDGGYLAQFARDAWAAWREMQRAADSASVCSTCNGSGEARGRTYHLGPDDHEIEVECPACFGLGEIKLSPGFKPKERACHVCNGRGTATAPASEVTK